MTTAVFQPLQPKIVLGVVAHPDDLEFSAAGTVAKYVAQGAKVYYLILTTADKGSSDRDMTPERLRDIRCEEQRAAGRILGLSDVFFGDYPDGTLEVTQAVKRDIVRRIRQVQPDTVITMNPTELFDVERGFINHPDHRAAAQACLDAVYPLARDHMTFPELLAEGLEPHKVHTVLMTGMGEANYREDITAYMDTKIQALRAHASQVPDPDGAEAMVRKWAEATGAASGARYAEGFTRLDLSF